MRGVRLPTYSYKCLSCDSTFEIQQSIHDSALSTCDKCEGDLKKVLAKVAVTFKGSGFYRTDSATDKKSD